MNKDQAAALRKPFPREAIGKLPKAGVQLDYVGHAATTDRLLSVDPAWTWEPAAVDDTGLPILGPGKGMWIKLTVCGVTRYGYGDGATVKEIIGDAIRNAAMRFGVALDLWSKEELEQAHGPAAQTSGAEEAPETGPSVESTHPSAPEPDPKAISAAQVKAIGTLMGKLGMTDRTLALEYVTAAVGRVVESRNDLTKGEASLVLDSLKADLEGAPA